MLPFFKEQFCEGMIFLHLKKQWFYWLLPLFVIYLLIVPSQSQILAEGAADLSKIIDVFDSAKIYLLLFAVWNMYLAMKLFLRKDTREVTYSLPWINKGVWCIIFQIFYLLLTLPYLIWLWNGTKAAGYEKKRRGPDLSDRDYKLFFISLFRNIPFCPWGTGHRLRLYSSKCGGKVYTGLRQSDAVRRIGSIFYL